VRTRHNSVALPLQPDRPVGVSGIVCLRSQQIPRLQFWPLTYKSPINGDGHESVCAMVDAEDGCGALLSLFAAKADGQA
jgi:hypothetical protein